MTDFDYNASPILTINFGGKKNIMLNEERKNEILKFVNLKGSVSVQELMQFFKASESTIRRDLNDLASKNMLTKVHGGAISISSTPNSHRISYDSEVLERENINRDEKIVIGKYAASLINNSELIYLDAGTTTGFIIDNLIPGSDIIIVTNGIMHAKRLAVNGFRVYMPGGLYKPATEAMVGEDAVINLGKYHFSKGFFGTNAVNTLNGFSTPDPSEAMIKKCALHQCAERYVLCDSAKFDKVSNVSFADYTDATILTTTNIPDMYKNSKNIITISL